MKKSIILLLAVTLSCAYVHNAYPQNVEGQVVAAQFGEFMVPSVGMGFSFPPDTCQVTGGNKNFPAFTTGVAIKVVDANPANTEIAVPVAAFSTSSNCSVSLPVVHAHSSFYLTSGTGGLQEALYNGISRTGGANTIILNTEWYALIQPRTAATVIASVVGNTSAGLVDVTTTPYTYYAWNGTQYSAVSSGGGASTPATTQLLRGTGTANAVVAATPGTDYVIPSGSVASLSGASAIPNGSTATTQSAGDNTTKLATDAFVIANTGGAQFPATNGVVYNTSPSVSRNATQADINSLIGYTPLAPSAIPATSALLKGNGTQGQSTNATAGTDYLLPSALPATGGILKTSGTAGTVTPAIAGTDYITPTPKFVNGVGHCEQYSGSDVSAKVNACIADAIALTNGNTTGTADASALVGTSVTTSEIDVGNSSGGFVKLLLPCTGSWQGSMTGGTADVLKQYAGAEVIGCPVSGLAAQFTLAPTSSSSLHAVFEMATSSKNYIHAQGFNVVNIGGGHATTSGYGALVNGQFGDGSFLEAVNVYDSLDTGAVLLRNVCCGFTWTHGSISSGFGGIPLTIQADSTSYVQQFNFLEGSIVGEGSGHPLISCTDTRSGHDTHIHFGDGYSETSNVNGDTAALVQVAGCSEVSFDHWGVYSNSSSNTATFLTTTNAYNTFVSLDEVGFYSSLGAWTYPVKVVNNGYTAEAIKYSDAAGAFAHYSTPSSPSTVGLLTAASIVDTGITASTSPICPNGTGGSFTTSGCSTGGSSTYTNGIASTAVTRTVTSRLQDGVSIKDFGAIGDGSSHPASANGYATLSALQAKYPFATATSNQMDWLAAQSAINAVATTGGGVLAPAGTYIFDQTLVIPVGPLDGNSATGEEIDFHGAGQGATFLNPTADLGAGNPLISCGPPAATASGATGRYSSGSGCPYHIHALTVSMPQSSVTAYGSAPTISGTAVAMDGIYAGARMYLDDLQVYGFYNGINWVADHADINNVRSNHNYCGFYLAPESQYLYGDLAFTGHNNFGGNSMAGICIDKDAYLTAEQSGELYIGHQPYGMLKFAGTPDSYAGGAGSNLFLQSSNFQYVQCESIGNACIWDDNFTNSAGGLASPAQGGAMLASTINLFTTYQSTLQVTSGGRGTYGFISAFVLNGLYLQAIQGSFFTSGANTVPSGEVAAVITTTMGYGNGGLTLQGDFDTLTQYYASTPLLDVTDGDGTNAYAKFINPGKWTGSCYTINGPLTVAAGKLLQNTVPVYAAAAAIATGALPVIGVAMQSMTAASGAAPCLAYADQGNQVPVNITGVTSAQQGQMLVAGASGAAVPYVPGLGGFPAGILINPASSSSGSLKLTMGNYISPSLTGGTKFTATGCGTIATSSGGSLTGQFTAASTTCAPVITTSITAPTGYFCRANDLSHPADLFTQASSTTTTATFSSTTVTSGDVVNFSCVPY